MSVCIFPLGRMCSSQTNCRTCSSCCGGWLKVEGWWRLPHLFLATAPRSASTSTASSSPSAWTTTCSTCSTPTWSTTGVCCCCWCFQPLHRLYNLCMLISFTCPLPRLTPRNCPLLSNRSLSESQPWFEMMVKIQEITRDLSGTRTASLPSIQPRNPLFHSYLWCRKAKTKSKLFCTGLCHPRPRATLPGQSHQCSGAVTRQPGISQQSPAGGTQSAGSGCHHVCPRRNRPGKRNLSPHRVSWKRINIIHAKCSNVLPSVPFDFIKLVNRKKKRF